MAHGYGTTAIDENEECGRGSSGSSTAPATGSMACPAASPSRSVPIRARRQFRPHLQYMPSRADRRALAGKHHWSGRVARVAGGGGGDRAHRIADAIGEADRLHRHRHLRLGDCRRQHFQKPVVLGQVKLPGHRDRSRGRQRVGICRGRDRRGGPADRQRRQFDESRCSFRQSVATPLRSRSSTASLRERRHQARCIRSCHGPSARRRLAVGNATITALAHDGATLYAMDSSNTSLSVDISSGNLVPQGSIVLPSAACPAISCSAGGRRLRRQRHRATGAMAAISRVDVSNPSLPKLLEGPDAQNIAGAAIALNGSGLGLTAQQIRCFWRP